MSSRSWHDTAPNSHIHGWLTFLVHSCDFFAGITLSAAEILGIQEKVGSLEVGKEANLVVLQEDPLQVDKMKIRDIKIVNRVFRGAKC